MKSDTNTKEAMSYKIERRLHRVMIKLEKSIVRCFYSKNCHSSENCRRCNVFYDKCSKFKGFNLNSL